MPTQKLFNKNFTLFAIGQNISLFGNSALRFALSLYVLEKTGSGAIFGSILAISMIPTILLSPIGGVLADRVSRKQIMAALDFVSAAMTFVCAFVANSPSTVVLIAVTMVVLSVIQSLYQPTAQASIPSLVCEKNLAAANGVLMQVTAIANLSGPILGGVLYAAFIDTVGIVPILIIAGICFVSSAAIKLFVKLPFTHQKVTETVVKIIVSDLKAGIGFTLLQGKFILKLLASVALFNLVNSAFIMIGTPFIVSQVLNLDSNYLGIIQALMSVGTILGALCIGCISKKMPFHKIYWHMIFGSLAFIPVAAAMMLFGGSPMIIYIILVPCLMLAYFTTAVYSISANTFFQRITPDHLLGKVSAIISTVVMCAVPIGQAIYGFLLDFFKNNMYILLFAAVVAGIAVSMLNKHHLKFYENREIVRIDPAIR